MKLAKMCLKFVAKPLSNRARQKAKNSPFFRNYMCIPPANLYHWCEENMSTLSKNITGKSVSIPRLPESSAIELGANLVGEGVVLLVGSTIFLLEYFRRRHNKQEKEAEKRITMDHVFDDLQTLYVSKAVLEEKVDKLTQITEDTFEVTIIPDPICNIEDVMPAHHIEDSSIFDFDTKSLVYKALDYLKSPF